MKLGDGRHEGNADDEDGHGDEEELTLSHGLGRIGTSVDASPDERQFSVMQNTRCRKAGPRFDGASSGVTKR